MSGNNEWKHRLLSKLTIQHHKLYCKIFNENLKYKHHVLLHYPRIMRLTGPIRNMSCIRFEAKHKELKATAKVVISRKNPSYTLALKQQLLLNYRFISQKRFCKRVEMGTMLSTGKYRCLPWFQNCPAFWAHK